MQTTMLRNGKDAHPVAVKKRVDETTGWQMSSDAVRTMQTTTMLRNGKDPHPVSVSQTASTRPQTGAKGPQVRHTLCTLQNDKGHHTVAVKQRQRDHGLGWMSSGTAHTMETTTLRNGKDHHPVAVKRRRRDHGLG